MNCKYHTLEKYSEQFYIKYPNTNIQLVELINSKLIKIIDDFGNCICDRDNLMWYGKTNIRTAINKSRYFSNVAKTVHGKKYNYKNVVYEHSRKKVEITCKLHGKFLQTPSTHLSGQGCPSCSKNSFIFKKTLTEENYILKLKRLHKGKYTIKKGTYVNRETKIPHYCNVQKEWFNMRPSHVISGQVCRKCANTKLSENAKNNSVGWSYKKWEEKGTQSKHFDSFKLYIIRCWNNNEEFYKLGKTFRTVESRFQSKTEMPYNWEVVKVIKNNALLISKLENKMKKINIKNKHIPLIDFNGKYECYKTIKT